MAGRKKSKRERRRKNKKEKKINWIRDRLEEWRTRRLVRKTHPR